MSRLTDEELTELEALAQTTYACVPPLRQLLAEVRRLRRMVITQEEIIRGKNLEINRLVNTLEEALDDMTLSNYMAKRIAQELEER